VFKAQNPPGVHSGNAGSWLRQSRFSWSPQSLRNATGDHWRRESKKLARLFLLAGLVQKLIARAKANQTRPAIRLIGPPLGHTPAQPAQHAVLFQRSDQFEPREHIAKQLNVQGLDGVKA